MTLAARGKASNPVVMVVYGTRPEAIKVAPVIKALEKSNDLDVVTVITAQHREMLDQVNEVFDIVPDVDLNLMQPGQTLNGIAARVLEKVDEVIVEHAPDAVLVQGDTTTVMAAGVAAFNRAVPVVHLEAGLRSGDLFSPFPEEGNRKLVSQIASLHLAPTEVSKANLLHDGVAESDIVVTGNTVIDALHWAVERPRQFSDPKLAEVVDSGRQILLVTTHRRENIGENMDNIGRAMRRLAERYPDLVLVWPAHKNPKVRETIGPHIADLENVISIEPVAYGEFAHVIGASHIVLTDSGGIQEEAPSLGKPVLVLRENTERPEAVDAGTVKLIGAKEDAIVAEVSKLMDDEAAFAAMANAVNPYGDGLSSGRCVDAMVKLLGS